MQHKILKLNDIKSTNLQTVLEILLKSEGISRTELAKKMKCDNTTISRAVRQLIDRGIILQGKKSEQVHGRPRVILELNPDGPVLIGLCVEADCLTGVITDLRGKILERDNVIFSGTPTKNQFLNQVEGVVYRLKKIAGNRVAGIGVSGFGTYSGKDFKLQNAAPLPALNGTVLQPFFNNIAKMHVTICDHLVAKISLLSYEYPKINTGTTLLISSEEGIGSMFTKNGQALFSFNNHSGEFGHIIIEPDGPKCGCGKSGCLEAIASLKTLTDSCRKHLQNPDLTFDDVCKSYQEGNTLVTEEVQKVVRYLGIAISNLINTCPVNQLIITGKILGLGENFQKNLEEYVQNAIFPEITEFFSIRFIKLDTATAIARGAAILAGRQSALFLQ